MSAFAAPARKPYRGAPMEGRLARWHARQTKNLIPTFASEARDIAALLPPSARVLEIAPGPGYLAVEIAKRGSFEVVGLDISESFVRIAADYAVKSGVRVAFRRGDAASIPFSPESFDWRRQVNGTLGERRRVLIQMASGDGACVGDLAPDSKAAVTRSAAGCSGCRFWMRDVKEVRDLIVNRQEPLRLPG
jgi:SAM-dependent methyltransferase